MKPTRFLSTIAWSPARVALTRASFLHPRRWSSSGKAACLATRWSPSNTRSYTGSCCNSPRSCNDIDVTQLMHDLTAFGRMSIRIAYKQINIFKVYNEGKIAKAADTRSIGSRRRVKCQCAVLAISIQLSPYPWYGLIDLGVC